MKLGKWAKFQTLHIYSLSTTLYLPRVVEIELIIIFALRAAVSEIRVNFQNCRIWAWNFAIGQRPYLGMKLGNWQKFQKLHICSFYPRGRNWVYFRSMGNGFWDMGWFSKLPFLGMNLAHWPRFQKLHIYTPSTPGGRNGTYFRSTGSVSQIWADFQNSHFGAWNSFKRSSFRDMGRFSKLPYLGMKHGKWAKLQKLHIYSLSTPGGRNWAYFRSKGSAFRDTVQF